MTLTKKRPWQLCRAIGPSGEGGKDKDKENNGAAGGDRTHDPWLRRPILYPLSYSRFGGMSKRHEGYSFSLLASTPGNYFPFPMNYIVSIIIGWARQRFSKQ